MSTNKKTIFKNITSQFTIQIANYLLPMVSVPIISRIIGPDKFGIINYAAAIVGYFILIVNYGFDLTATRKVAQNKNDNVIINELFSTILWCKFFLFLVTLVLFLACFAIFPVFVTEWKVMVYSYIFIVSLVITPNWLYQGMQELNRVAIFNVITKILFTVAVLLAVRNESDYVYYPLIFGVAQIVVGYYSFYYAMHRYNIQIIKVPFKQTVKILKKEYLVFFSTVVINLYTTTNTVILGAMADNAQVGYYTAAIKIVLIVQAVITLPLSNSFFPYVGAAFSTGRDEGVHAAQKVLPIVTLVGLIALVGMVLLGPSVLRLFYGDRFSLSIPIFLILSATPLLIVVSNVYAIQVMVNLLMDKAFLRITAVGALISVIANLLLIPSNGGVGAAYSLLITETFILLACVFYLSRQGINLLTWRYFNLRSIVSQAQSVFPRFKKTNS
jgi:O-antigen/teichoic acid export membrane protein